MTTTTIPPELEALIARVERHRGAVKQPPRQIPGRVVPDPVPGVPIDVVALRRKNGNRRNSDAAHYLSQRGTGTLACVHTT